MTQAELKQLLITELLEMADKAMDLYIAASIDSKTKKLAEQRQPDLSIIQKVIFEKRSNENPLI